MSRSTFLTTSSETPSLSSSSSPDRARTLHFHHRLMPVISSSNRSHETLPTALVQSSPPPPATANDTSQRQSVVRLNPKIKRNLRGKRRSTGIHPDEVSLASALNDILLNEDEAEDESTPTNVRNQFLTETSESYDHNRISPPKPVFKVSRVQPTFDENTRHSFDKLSISRADPFVMTSSSATSTNNYPNTGTKLFRPEQFILRRHPSDDESSSIKYRQLEERIRTLESLVFEKDSVIHDLQRKLDKVTRDLNEADQQVYILQRDKLTLIKTLTALQENKSGDHPTSTIRTGFLARN